MQVLPESEAELLRERQELAEGRIREALTEELVKAPYDEFFKKAAGFILNPTYDAALPENYASSWLNPVYAVSKCGTEMGRMLSFLSYELLNLVAFRTEGLLMDVVILEEVFLEIYSSFIAAEQEEGTVPSEKVIHGILYSFVSDYTDYTVSRRIREMVDPSESEFAMKIIMESDLTDISYLDKFGEYIDDDVRKIAAYLNTFSEEEIQSMADTFTEGYRMGFINTGKDLSKKRSVAILYELGFERMIRAAVHNFEKLGLSTTIYRHQLHAANRSGMNRSGYSGAWVNKQMAFDHQEDQALFLDKAFMTRKLEVMEHTFEEVKDLARAYGGPAVMETFGAEPFKPETHSEAYALSPEQQKLAVDLAVEAGKITNRYIPGDERSFTIISYPVPSISKDFEKIFDATVKLNNLEASRYERIQQALILQLEKGRKVEVKGRNGNKTDLVVSLHEQPDPASQTVFENCTADVNIPVGEAFTTPSLPGTDGTLFVSEVYLMGLRFENLEFHFKDGFVTDYNCTNFSTDEENKKYIRDHILHHHETLPIGEFAIGTNTLAYRMAKDFDIFSRLDILIAEKTGPHFALGDTCYDRAEDVAVFNPDGREIIARDNEYTIKRKTDPSFRYFQCHTDITIPYDELDTITAIDDEGNRYPVIAGGRFVVPGTEELNEPLEN
ncbi:Leucyl aminopeptidase (aminopeptidase T) [Lachnospiraceae bacterium]|nr:Leucyl aminopeptidase (aminopeptidase T) [Lachnospiraceae bacterium]